MQSARPSRRTLLAASLALLPLGAVGTAAAKTPQLAPRTRRRTFNVRHYGAVGDGRADDTAAVRRAVRAAERDGGGTVYLPRGSYRLDDYTRGSWGYSWLIPISGNGIAIRGEGAETVVRSRADRYVNQIVFWPTGVGRLTSDLGDLRRWVPRYSVVSMEPAHRRDDWVHLGADHPFRRGDVVFIRTGQTIGNGNLLQPDAEINEVTAVTGSRIRLRYPLAKDYVQEYSPAPTYVPSQPGAVGLPLPFGVAQMSHGVIRDFELEGLSFDTPNAQFWCLPTQVLRVRMADVGGRFGTAALGALFARNITMERIEAQKAGDESVGSAVAGGASGVTDLRIRDVRATGRLPAMVHLHEGVAQATVERVHLRSEGSPSNRDGGISIRARSYDTTVRDCSVIGGTTTGCLTVDDNCVSGGVIARNSLEPTYCAYSAAIEGSKWQVEDNLGTRPFLIRSGNERRGNHVRAG